MAQLVIVWVGFCKLIQWSPTAPRARLTCRSAWAKGCPGSFGIEFTSAVLRDTSWQPHLASSPLHFIGSGAVGLFKSWVIGAASEERYDAIAFVGDRNSCPATVVSIKVIVHVKTHYLPSHRCNLNLKCEFSPISSSKR
jgi:hypothetical protein